MRSNDTLESRYDAIIVGARVAGSGTAMLLARAGLRVLALEKSAYGTDTLSTHALMRPGVLQLHRWGLLDRIIAAGTPDIRKTTFHYGDAAVPVEIQERDGVAALYAPRRTVLDSVLADGAQEAGAQISYGVRVEGIVHDGNGRVCGVDLIDSSGVRRRIEAEMVIGADGTRSGVARSVGAEIVRQSTRPGAYLYGYWRGLRLDGTHWYYGQDVAAGVIPTNEDLTCLFVGMPPKRRGSGRSDALESTFWAVLREIDPNLAAEVASQERVGKLRSFPGQPGFIRKSWGAGWALVGDAGFFKDPLTAHGITDALRDAELLANSVIAGSDEAMAAYQVARDELAVEFLDLSDEIASFDWNMKKLQEHHYRLSKLMGREYDLVRSLDSYKPATAA